VNTRDSTREGQVRREKNQKDSQLGVKGKAAKQALDQNEKKKKRHPRQDTKKGMEKRNKGNQRKGGKTLSKRLGCSYNHVSGGGEGADKMGEVGFRGSSARKMGPKGL